VAKPELGTKRVDPVTGRKFYDLNKEPIVSPFTGISYPRSAFEAPVTTRGGRVAQAAAEEETTAAADENVELVSLEDADAEQADTGTKAAATTDDDDVELEDEPAGEEDAFLEEEEDGDTDVADLIDGDLEEDEET
jgi:uncharacterized protein (TIGR02300 family)